MNAPSTNDEAFREIQLNGKQLVFLFMAATVVSVVIFLCGVLVGRGARPDRPAEQDVAAAEIAPDPGAAPPVAPQNAAPPEAEPPAPADELTYAERLQRETPPEEILKEAPPPAAPPPAAVAPPPPATPAPTARATTSPAPVSNSGAIASDPSGPGFAVQVAAFGERRDADTVAKGLVAKGYPAFVMEPAVKGSLSRLYRVRVGKYKDKNDAQTVLLRLKEGEKFENAWIAQ